MKKLIISNKQMIRLNEVTAIATANGKDQISNTMSNLVANNPEADNYQVNNTQGNNGTTYQGTEATRVNDIADMPSNGSTYAENNPDKQVSESIILKKSDIKRLQKKNGKVFSKKDFKKKLDEDYNSFLNSLNERRNK